MTGLDIEYIEGKCPVQGGGTFDGEPFYFRARGNRWSVEVGGWEYVEGYGNVPYAAGWMDEVEARAFINKAYNEWRYKMSKLTPKQEEHLQSILAQNTIHTRDKFIKGAEEHGGDLLDMPLLQLVDNAIDEATDLLVYLRTLRGKLK